MVMEQKARNRAFALQEAAGQRAERTAMADIERRGRLDAAGFDQMKAQRQTIEQNMADWETLSGSISEPEYRRGIIAIRSGKTPPYLKQQRDAAGKPPADVYRASDRDALFNMASEYARSAPWAEGREWGPNWKQADLISQYKQFLVDNNYSDLNDKDKQMLELQWEEAMSSEKEFGWDPASSEVRQAREEMRSQPNSDTKSEIGHYLTQLEQDGGKKASAEFRKKWSNPANRTIMLAQLRQRYGNVQQSTGRPQ